MQSVVVKSEQVKLPSKIARKLKGRELEILETKDGVLLRPLSDPITTARGFLKNSKFSTERYLQMKREEKELER